MLCGYYWNGKIFTQKIINKFKDLVVSSDTDAIYEDISTGGISEQKPINILKAWLLENWDSRNVGL